MKTYIALLRGINVSGQKKILMLELRKILSEIGFKNVQTYIQSGNVVFESTIENRTILEEKIQKVILLNYGFEVPVLVTSGKDLISIIDNNPFAQEDPKKQYFVLLKNKPEVLLVDTLNKIEYQNEDFSIAKQCVYLACHKGAGKAKLNNNFIERKLKVQATTRNLKTMEKLIEMTNR